MSEVLQGTLYWQEIRDGFFVHNEDFNKTIERIPDLMSAEVTLHKLQTASQLLYSGMKGYGTIGHVILEGAPDPKILTSNAFLNDDDFPVENLFLQWVYQFSLVESISSNFHNKPLPEWPSTFLEIVEANLHTMTYVAALIYLYEQGRFKALVSRENFQYTENDVKDAVRGITGTLYSKGAEYGESYRRHGLQGTLPRLWDKIARYAQLSALGRSATYEPKMDSAKDLLGYCVIAWSLIHELDNHPCPLLEASNAQS
jgi:hypothetical protein